MSLMCPSGTAQGKGWRLECKVLKVIYSFQIYCGKIKPGLVPYLMIDFQGGLQALSMCGGGLIVFAWPPKAWKFVAEEHDYRLCVSKLK